uniref:KIB1-4 beta-propeller domain-containing protein n=1 Tax=Oryza brachyantha TaxID=4533 RepID=J3KUG5_ORYBR
MADELPPPADDSELPLADFPAVLVREIVAGIRCNLDRERAEKFGDTWREEIQLLGPLPPPLPLLLVPRSNGAPVFHCALSNWRTHPYYLQASTHAARFFGSYDGGWYFVSLGQTEDHFLLNLEDPDLFFRLPDRRSRGLIVLHPFPLEPTLWEDKIVIVAATLSRQPTERGCVAAGIIGYLPICQDYDIREIAFWGMGDGEREISYTFREKDPDLKVEDLLYSHVDEAFLFLTRGEHIHEFHQPIFPLEHTNQEVVRFQQRRGDGDGPAEVRNATNAKWEFEAEHHWAELPALEGRILFVGKGCSRSYEVAHGYPGMEGIYFLDDLCFYDPMIVFRARAQRR